MGKTATWTRLHLESSYGEFIAWRTQFVLWLTSQSGGAVTSPDHLDGISLSAVLTMVVKGDVTTMLCTEDCWGEACTWKRAEDALRRTLQCTPLQLRSVLRESRQGDQPTR